MFCLWKLCLFHFFGLLGQLKCAELIHPCTTLVEVCALLQTTSCWRLAPRMVIAKVEESADAV